MNGELNTAASAWPDPEPLRKPSSVNPLTTDMLPNYLRAYVMDNAARLGVSPEMIAGPMLIALGSLLGLKIGICPKAFDSYLEFANLWGYVVADAASKKTPAAQIAFRAIHEIDEDEFKLYEANASSRLLVEKMTKARLTELTKKAETAAAKGDSIVEFSEEYGRLSRQKNEPWPRTFTINASVEKLEVLLAANPNGMLVERDELSGFFAQMEMPGHNGERSFYLSAWNGHASISTDRITRASVRLSNVLISVFGTMTPESLTGLLLNPAIKATASDGMTQRFQLAFFPDRAPLVRTRDSDRYPDFDAENVVMRIFRDFYKYRAAASLKRTRRGIPFIRFDDDAQQVFYDWSDAVLERMNSGSLHPAMVSHLGKYSKLMSALSLIFYMVKQLGGEKEIEAIDETSARLAVRWCDCLELHARRIYAGLASPEEETAKLIARRLLNGALEEKIAKNGGFLKPSDIYSNGWQGLGDADTVVEGCVFLAELNWLATETMHHRAGGRPSHRFKLNPKCLQLFGKDFKEQKIRFVKNIQPATRKVSTERSRDGRRAFAR